jgi:hypothetical protein
LAGRELAIERATLKRVLRWIRARSKAAKVAVLVVAIGAVASVALLSISSGGKKTGVQTPAPAASNGSILPGAPSVGTSGSTAAPAPGSAPATSTPAAKAAAPATATAPPGSSKVVQLPPNVGPRTLLTGTGSYAARCADGTVSSSPDMGRVCYGHKGVKYFIPRAAP